MVGSFRGKSFLIWILVLTILSTGIYGAFRLISQHIIAENLKSFFHALSLSDHQKALSFISCPSESSLKDFLPELEDPSSIKLAEIRSIHFIDFSNASCQVTIHYKGKPYPFIISSKLTGCEWKFYSLPRWQSYIGILSSSQVAGSHTGYSGYSYRFHTPLGEHTLTSPIPFSRTPSGYPYRVLAWGDNLLELEPLVLLVSQEFIQISNSYIEDRTIGKLALSSTPYIYENEKGSILFKNKEALIPGLKNLRLFLYKDKVCAVLLPRDKTIDMLRILIHNDQYQSLEHKKITITSNENFTISIPAEKKETVIPANSKISLIPHLSGGIQWFVDDGRINTSSNRIFITPSKNNKLFVMEIQRYKHPLNRGTPYRGYMEVTEKNGSLILINVVSPEEYLYSVVPSEMPVHFGLEALKVQSIAARSYAISALFGSGWNHLGAHLDDSTSSQVYNNNPEYPISTKAVRQTSGIVAVYGNSIIKSVFFSTSCGSTANHEEVWEDPLTKSFPGQRIPYLIHKLQGIKASPKLNDPKEFKAFIKDTSLTAYDKDSPFFRWKVVWTKKELDACLKQNLPKVQKKQPEFVLTYNGRGEYIQNEIQENEIGEFVAVKNIQRGEGGNILSLDIHCTKAIFRIIKELNIRNVFRPVQYIDGTPPIQVQCHDETQRDNFPLLPSTFAIFEIEKNRRGEIERIIIHGGGYGHGCGMSQYGALGMAKRGYSYGEIIKHYYPGSELKQYKKIHYIR